MSDPETWRTEYANDPIDLPPEIDTTVPSVARVYDYGLGGKNNFAIDRQVGDELTRTHPGGIALARHNRAVLRRGVHWMVADGGIRQIIDVGSGLPSTGNVHEVAHAIDPAVRVVYVDHDPSVLAHGRALLADNHTTTVIQADAADPRAILDDPVTAQFIDFDQPWGLVLAGILHHLSDEQDPVRVTKTFRDQMPAGSFLLASNFLDDDSNDPRVRALERDLLTMLGSGWFRTWGEQRAYFEGLELVEPGLVYANDWRPDMHTELNSEWHTFFCAGIGRKP